MNMNKVSSTFKDTIVRDGGREEKKGNRTI